MSAAPQNLQYFKDLSSLHDLLCHLGSAFSHTVPKALSSVDSSWLHMIWLEWPCKWFHCTCLPFKNALGVLIWGFPDPYSCIGETCTSQCTIFVLLYLEMDCKGNLMQPSRSWSLAGRRKREVKQSAEITSHTRARSTGYARLDASRYAARWGVKGLWGKLHWHVSCAALYQIVSKSQVGK